MSAPSPVLRLVREIRRRGVDKVMAVYLVVAWLAIQVAATTFPFLLLPAQGVRMVIAAAVLCLPLVGALAWVFDLTPEGLKRTLQAEPGAAAPGGPRAAAFLLAPLFLASAYLGWLAWAHTPAPEAATAPVAMADTSAISSIAVLPFVNISGDPQNEYFSDGMTEELLNALAQVPGLQVAARTSSFSFKGKNVPVDEIGRRLGVGSLLEGSVRKDGKHLRITAQLVTARGFHLWSNTYDRELKEVFAIQEEISAAIVGALRPRLAGLVEARLARHSTNDLAAYELFLKGHDVLKNAVTEAQMREAIASLEKAIAIDPNYALADADLAMARMGLEGFMKPGSMLEEARPMALRAIELDPNLAEGYLAMAVISEHEWKWKEAGDLFRKSIALNPTLAAACACYGHYLYLTGQREAAIRELERARSLDPLAPGSHAILAAMYWGAGRSEEARRMVEEALRLDPRSPIAHLVTAWMERGLGHYDVALAHLTGGAPHPESLDFRELDPRVAAEIGYTFAVSGRRADAQRVARQMEERARTRFTGPELIAGVYVGLGDQKRAMELLRSAYDQHSGLGDFTLYPYARPLMNNPEYRALLQRAGLPAPR
jgi:adenylate cyclase